MIKPTECHVHSGGYGLCGKSKGSSKRLHWKCKYRVMHSKNELPLDKTNKLTVLPVIRSDTKLSSGELRCPATALVIYFIVGPALAWATSSFRLFVRPFICPSTFTLGVLWANLLLQFCTDHFETLQVFSSWYKDVHVVWI